MFSFGVIISIIGIVSKDDTFIILGMLVMIQSNINERFDEIENISTKKED